MNQVTIGQICDMTDVFRGSLKPWIDYILIGAKHGSSKIKWKGDGPSEYQIASLKDLGFRIFKSKATSDEGYIYTGLDSVSDEGHEEIL